MGHSVTLPRRELEELEKKAAAFDKLFKKVEVLFSENHSTADIEGRWIVTLDQSVIKEQLLDDTRELDVQYNLSKEAGARLMMVRKLQTPITTIHIQVTDMKNTYVFVGE
jgi:hypothetical protein